MSPIVAQPNRGYADWQRIANYDTPALLNVTNVSTPYAPSAQDVSRFSHVGFFIGQQAVPQFITFEWFLDPALTQQCGQQFFVMDPAINAPMQGHYPNLGPFLSVTANCIPNPGHFTGLFWASNRDVGYPITPKNPVIVDQQNAAIGIDTTVNVYPSDYYAGPAQVWFSPIYATGSLEFQYETVSGAWDYFQTFAFLAQGPINYPIDLPPGAWRVVVFNSTASAVTYFLTVTPSQTGSN